MKNYYRWAVLAGTAMLSVSNVFPAWADEAGGNGSSLSTALEVPVSDGQQNAAEDGSQAQPDIGSQPSVPIGTADPGAESGQQPSEAVGTVQPGTEGSQQITGTAGTTETNGETSQAGSDSSQATSPNTSATRVIRAGESQDSSAAGNGGSAEMDYSKGPGYVPQPKDQGQQPVSSPAQLDINGQANQDPTIQIYDLVNPVVKVTEKYSYDQMVQDINVLQQTYGSRMQVNPIGTSLDGRTLYDCIVGNPAAPKHILIQGGIHGREYLNPMLLMQQMEMILANYDTGFFHGNSLASMFEQIAVHFVPMTNPDGITISQFGIEGIRSQQLRDAVSTCYVMDMASGRTSADPASYLSRWKANAQGVDLNLNFDALWTELYSTAFPSYSGYKGTAPGSEPESQAMINLYLAQYPWKAVIHYHSMGNVIYWDILGNKVQQESAELANLMSAVTGGYRILPSEGGGGYKDWIQLSDNPVPSVTLETGSVSCPMPLSEYSSIWAQNRLTWAYAMEWVAGRQ